VLMVMLPNSQNDKVPVTLPTPTFRHATCQIANLQSWDQHHDETWSRVHELNNTSMSRFLISASGASHCSNEGTT
jgi:hypothetical protein